MSLPTKASDSSEPRGHNDVLLRPCSRNPPSLEKAVPPGELAASDYHGDETQRPPLPVASESKVHEEVSVDLDCPIIHRIYCDHPHVDGEDHSEHPDSADF